MASARLGRARPAVAPRRSRRRVVPHRQRRPPVQRLTVGRHHNLGPYAARPGSLSDRQRTTVSRRARRRPGAQSRATKSLRAAVPGPPLQGEGRPLCNRSSIRPIRTSRNLLDLGSRSWRPARPAPRRTGQEDVRWRLCRAALRGTAARVYQVRAAIPGGQGVSYQRGRQRTTYRTWPAGALRLLRDPDRVQRRAIASLARPSRSPGPGPDAATVLEVISPAGRSTRTVERQVARHRLDLPGGDDITSAVRAHHRRRQPHIDRKARQASRAPSRSRLPPRGMHRRKMSTDQPLVAHRLPSLTSRPAAVPTTFCSAGRTSSLREAYGP